MSKKQLLLKKLFDQVFLRTRQLDKELLLAKLQARRKQLQLELP